MLLIILGQPIIPHLKIDKPSTFVLGFAPHTKLKCTNVKADLQIAGQPASPKILSHAMYS